MTLVVKVPLGAALLEQLQATLEKTKCKVIVVEKPLSNTWEQVILIVTLQGSTATLAVLLVEESAEILFKEKQCNEVSKVRQLFK